MCIVIFYMDGYLPAAAELILIKKIKIKKGKSVYVK